MKTTLYITRHGETQWNIERRLQGWQDSPLTALGVCQAQWLGEALREVAFTAIYTSPSQRTRTTAELIGAHHSCDIIPHDALRELYMGDWEGKTREELQQREPEIFAAFWSRPHLYRPVNGSESFYDLRERVLPFLQSVLEKQKGETLLLVTHAATLKTIMAFFDERPMERLWEPPAAYPTGLCKVVIEEQKPLIELYGDISHYREWANVQG
ncbi:putative phosphoglycerate mutase [Thermosporothrix hazakensis]|jgi:probable phosphoglycerate mutase|uniref:Putative phosphoglycerate mutase n=1 Tax=Thermosporothrix hazakensis TaxID=644383 RepID=A0A326U9E8_THEHA|nr:histidine phosphatase family protein [Thermosporothrix hazakensis]PZW31147.1 putative phosphoglycerate mutase [Thermosporothrix hazakensis]GCE50941.1 phosphatase [Thermosporothrix hazakensis]